MPTFQLSASASCCPERCGSCNRHLHTTTPHGRLMLTVLGGLAEFERELIRARTDDGRRRAQARGVRFGRVQADLARSYGVSQATISRLAAPSPFEARAAGL